MLHSAEDYREDDTSSAFPSRAPRWTWTPQQLCSTCRAQVDYEDGFLRDNGFWTHEPIDLAKGRGPAFYTDVLAVLRQFEAEFFTNRGTTGGGLGGNGVFGDKGFGGDHGDKNVVPTWEQFRLFAQRYQVGLLTHFFAGRSLYGNSEQYTRVWKFLIAIVQKWIRRPAAGAAAEEALGECWENKASSSSAAPRGLDSTRPKSATPTHCDVRRLSALYLLAALYYAQPGWPTLKTMAHTNKTRQKTDLLLKLATGPQVDKITVCKRTHDEIEDLVRRFPAARKVWNRLFFVDKCVEVAEFPFCYRVWAQASFENVDKASDGVPRQYKGDRLEATNPLVAEARKMAVQPGFLTRRALELPDGLFANKHDGGCKKTYAKDRAGDQEIFKNKRGLKKETGREQKKEGNLRARQAKLGLKKAKRGHLKAILGAAEGQEEGGSGLLALDAGACGAGWDEGRQLGESAVGCGQTPRDEELLGTQGAKRGKSVQKLGEISEAEYRAAARAELEALEARKNEENERAGGAAKTIGPRPGQTVFERRKQSVLDEDEDDFSLAVAQQEPRNKKGPPVEKKKPNKQATGAGCPPQQNVVSSAQQSASSGAKGDRSPGAFSPPKIFAGEGGAFSFADGVDLPRLQGRSVEEELASLKELQALSGVGSGSGGGAAGAANGFDFDATELLEGRGSEEEASSGKKSAAKGGAAARQKTMKKSAAKGGVAARKIAPKSKAKAKAAPSKKSPKKKSGAK